ncbi:PREDICTED: F-box/LRR-repeat/kelch-repeat protein At1g09650-like [Camelina sativa]|uniref:F-box/LRR-repeat/kelch-repeat protein At1g09650-like n=1 Tax=Camelina sativa TaxID=90675 RepID=A0ABM0X4U6_CAMSA|nr:PREDICTED: F-box/LRR-repeat/kelch-repeat protein At1g09650-like [Camelina sativa]
MSKKLCSRTECLYHDVVELILERAPATSLMRFKAVPKQWKSTIESPFFQERQYKHRQQSGDPDVLMVSVFVYEDGFTDPEDVEQISEIECLRTLVVGSSSSLQIPTPWDNTYYFVAESSCDGLVCLYFPDRSGFVVNPTTRWHRVLPLSGYNQLIIDTGKTILFEPGFGKDKFTGRYKAVWLYNSSELSLEDGTATTCEVFDFTTNAWRYVTPSAPYRIFSRDPAFVDGSLYWFTVDCPETQVISLDLHTEAFQVIPVTPFANAKPEKFNMCNLDDRLSIPGRATSTFGWGQRENRSGGA